MSYSIFDFQVYSEGILVSRPDTGDSIFFVEEDLEVFSEVMSVFYELKEEVLNAKKNC